MTLSRTSAANLNSVVPEIIDLDSWEKQVLLKSSIPIAVDFYATWCGPCQYVSPIIEKLASEFEGTVRFAKLDIDKNRSIANKYNIQSIPTIVIFISGKEVARTVGALPKDRLQRFIQEHTGGKLQRFIQVQ